TVQRGDSLYAIAKRYGTTPQNILALNGLTANATIYIGQMLRVKAPSNTPPRTNGNFQTYTVKSGDWLAKIADQFGTSPDEIARLNNLGSGGLRVGQQLLIPSKRKIPVPSFQTGKAGDIEKARSIFQLQEISGVEIFGNGLQGPVGKVFNNHPADLEKVQNRLVQLRILNPNHGESPRNLMSRLGRSPIGQGSIPKTVKALESFQSKYRVDYWTKNPKHVKMLGTSSFTRGTVVPNDVTYKVLREYAEYTLVVPHPTLKGRLITSQFNNFVRSSFSEYYNGVGFQGNYMPDVPFEVFAQLGLDENMALALKYVSSHEGNFDAINTYDKANFSWGFIQFAGKGGNTNGSLGAVIATMKQKNPQLFAEFFQKVGIDIDIITRRGEIHDGTLKVFDIHAVTGKHETSGLDAEIALKSDKQLYGAFIRAAYHPSFYSAQLERAVIGYVKPALGIKTDINTRSIKLSNVPLNRIISSPMGSGLIVDLTVNQWINKTRDIFKSAIEKVATRRGINTPGVLQQIDEREVLQQIIANAVSDARIKKRASSILNSTLSPRKPNFVPPLV
ncbi:MAG: LysM peptidoglycan-binding domain-containing protein, partial [Bacteroidota bacterium]